MGFSVRHHMKLRNATKEAMPIVKAGHRMWNPMVKPNWMRESVVASMVSARSVVDRHGGRWPATCKVESGVSALTPPCGSDRSVVSVASIRDPGSIGRLSEVNFLGDQSVFRARL